MLFTRRVLRMRAVVRVESSNNPSLVLRRNIRCCGGPNVSVTKRHVLFFSKSRWNANRTAQEHVGRQRQVCSSF